MPWRWIIVLGLTSCANPITGCANPSGSAAAKPQAPASCRTNRDCRKAKLFCALPSGCTASARKLGTCKPRPEVCAMEYAPVCGCDSKTYGNACEANAAGTNVARDGACALTPPTACACRVLDDCCTCEAQLKSGGPGPSCGRACKRSVCAQWGLRQAEAYCASDKCVLADAGTRCRRDDDCSLHNDCCLCAALPKSIKLPACPRQCLAPECLSIGERATHARCISGVCRLAPR